MKYQVEVEQRTVICAYAEIEIEADSEAEARDKAEWLDDDDLDFGHGCEPDIEYRVTEFKEIK